LLSGLGWNFITQCLRVVGDPIDMEEPKQSLAAGMMAKIEKVTLKMTEQVSLFDIKIHPF
jgi:hypothetical protein